MACSTAGHRNFAFRRCSQLPSNHVLCRDSLRTSSDSSRWSTATYLLLEIQGDALSTSPDADVTIVFRVARFSSLDRRPGKRLPTTKLCSLLPLAAAIIVARTPCTPHIARPKAGRLPPPASRSQRPATAAARPYRPACASPKDLSNVSLPLRYRRSSWCTNCLKVNLQSKYAVTTHLMTTSEGSAP